VVAQDAGLSEVEAIVMSAIVYAGSAQFSAVAILAQGGGAGAAIAAAALMNSRFLPMGVAFAPSLRGGPIKRALQGQAVVDASWALASRPDGSFDRMLLFGSSAAQYTTWVTGTTLGALLALALVPVAPAGVPVLVASLAALVGLTRGAREAVLQRQEAEGEPR
jgi:predicted branched-subunit amino acid permease